MTETFLIKVSQSLVTEIEVTEVDEDRAKQVAMEFVRGSYGLPEGSRFSASVLGSWPDGEPMETDLGMVLGLEMRRGWFWSTWRNARTTGGLITRDISFDIAVTEDQIEPGETAYEVLSSIANVPYMNDPQRQYGVAARKRGDLLWFGPCRTEKQARRMYHQGHTHLRTSHG